MRAAALRPETCWIALETMDGPRPSSTGEYGGESALESRYSAGSSEGGCCRQIVRNAFVSVSSLAMRDRVAESVASAWARNAYGTGALGCQSEAPRSYVAGSAFRGL